MHVVQQVGSVLLVFGLLGLAVWKLRRGGAPRAELWPGRGLFPSNNGRMRALESVERLVLTPQHALHLVRIRGREVVVATHPQGCALLVETTERNPGAGA
jgi:hypothetical protein